MNDYIIEMKNVSKRFHDLQVLENLNLQVEQGKVYGLLGRNGVGKTTTIQIMLGLLRSDTGSSKVFLLDSEKENLEIKKRVGYVAEGQKLYSWMTVKELLWFVSKFYSTWDKVYAKQLLKKFEINEEKKIDQLSRGMLSKVSLTLAMAHRPKLLVLDEATSGLDAIVRKAFLESIIEFVEQEGMTVFISSHLLNDVERIVDHVGFLDGGHIKISGELDTLKQSYRKVQLTFSEEPKDSLEIPGVLDKKISGRQTMYYLKDFTEETHSLLKKSGASINYIDMNLEELFTECLIHI